MRLVPVTRRSFLATTLTTSAVLFGAPMLRARRRVDDDLETLIIKTPAGDLVEACAARLVAGLAPEALLRSAALVAARSFVNQDSLSVLHGYMALASAWRLRTHLPSGRDLLPLLGAVAHVKKELGEVSAPAPAKPLHEVTAVARATQALIAAVREGNQGEAESLIAALAAQLPPTELRDLVMGICGRDFGGSHKLIMVVQAFALIELLPSVPVVELLRPAIRLGASLPQDRTVHERALSLLEELDLATPSSTTGSHTVPDCKSVVEAIATGDPETASAAMAAAIADGLPLDAAGECLANVAASTFLRLAPSTSLLGPVHQSTSANAAQHVISNASRVNAIVAILENTQRQARSAAGMRAHVKDDPADRELRRNRSPDELLAAIRGAILENDRVASTALVLHYGECGAPSAPLLALLANVAATDSGTSGHNFKHQQAMVEQFDWSRSPTRYHYLAAAARFAAAYAGQTTEIHARAAKALGLPS